MVHFRVYESLLSEASKVNAFMDEEEGWILQGIDDNLITWQIFGEDFNGFEITQFTHSSSIVQGFLKGQQFILVSEDQLEGDHYIEVFRFKSESRLGQAYLVRQVLVTNAEPIEFNTFFPAERFGFVQRCETDDGEVFGVVRLFDFEIELRVEISLEGFEVPEACEVKVLSEDLIVVNAAVEGSEEVRTMVLRMRRPKKGSGDGVEGAGGPEGVNKVDEVEAVFKLENSLKSISDRCMWLKGGAVIAQEQWLDSYLLDQDYYKIYRF